MIAFQSRRKYHYTDFNPDAVSWYDHPLAIKQDDGKRDECSSFMPSSTKSKKSLRRRGLLHA